MIKGIKMLKVKMTV